MPTLSEGSPEARRIDDALGAWRQGDVALDEIGFVHLGDPAEPLTESTGEGGDPGIQPVVSEVAGLIVVTQTCDLVRSCIARPYVEVSPLVEVGASSLDEIRRGRRPRYATFGALLERGLVADLDRATTFEKSIVARWRRTSGCATDEESRRFAAALARKRGRTAFPDDFTEFVQKLVKRLIGKHGKASAEGDALRALREIRVTASPDWQADTVSLMFRFVCEPDQTLPEGLDAEALLDTWLALLPAVGRFTTVDGTITTLEDMTAAEYVEGDLLDLDHLSLPR